MTSLTTIKNWFRTGLKPTQQQFWDTWDSFWHKSEKIPAGSIEGIDVLLNQKANKSVVDNHLTDANAHADLFAAKADKSALEAHLTDANAHAELFATKADKSALAAHLTDENAHADLFAKIRFIPHGELLVFEPAGKTTPGILTAGDYCQGYVEGEFINANYLGGDPTVLASYDI